MFRQFASITSKGASKPKAFALAFAIVCVWAAVGPFFRYSDTWQLVINTGTTIVNFLLGFIILYAGARDSAAIQAKLDELIRVTQAADNRLIKSEELAEEALEAIKP